MTDFFANLKRLRKLWGTEERPHLSQAVESDARLCSALYGRVDLVVGDSADDIGGELIRDLFQCDRPVDPYLLSCGLTPGQLAEYFRDEKEIRISSDLFYELVSLNLIGVGISPIAGEPVLLFGKPVVIDDSLGLGFCWLTF